MELPNWIWQVDIALLRATYWVINFLHDWLSLSQRNLERIWIAISLMYWAWTLIVWPAIKSRSAFSYGFDGAIACLFLAFILHLMIKLHQLPDSVRIKNFAFSGFTRLVVICVSLLGSFLDVLMHGNDLAGNFLYVIFLYITSFPYSGNKPGNKRKMALSKVVEMFGTGWMVPNHGAVSMQDFG